MLTHSLTPAALTAITPENVRAFFQKAPAYPLRHGTESSIFLYDNQHVIKLFTADEDGSPRKKCLAVEVKNL